MLQSCRSIHSKQLIKIINDSYSKATTLVCKHYVGCPILPTFITHQLANIITPLNSLKTQDCTTDYYFILVQQ